MLPLKETAVAWSRNLETYLNYRCESLSLQSECLVTSARHANLKFRSMRALHQMSSRGAHHWECRAAR